MRTPFVQSTSLIATGIARELAERLAGFALGVDGGGLGLDRVVIEEHERAEFRFAGASLGQEGVGDLGRAGFPFGLKREKFGGGLLEEGHDVIGPQVFRVLKSIHLVYDLMT